MAVSTTQSIWRSGGGDQTRTAYCGSGVMVAEWYVSNVATQAGNVKVSSATNAPALILPAGAVIIELATNVASSTGGTLDFGFTLYTSGTASPTALANEQPTTRTSTTLGTASIPQASFGIAMSATQMVYITAATGASAGVGSCSGYIVYYVTDPLAGQQSA